MSADGHGLPDNAVLGAHDFIHHAEQEEHEHEAAAKRGLPDKAAEAEYDLMHHAEEDLAKAEAEKNKGGLKKKMEKILPGRH
ncbi:hypothetical protein F5Y10DRAFT_260040 [Nemania abortiva]|nr:hypothetical protein F5Y10DRAFT_260040 [Nemania abortiva]